MSATTPTTCKASRMEQQVHRLRNRLAEAWRSGCSPDVIHRLEKMISRRWQLMESARTRNDHKDLQPE